MSGKGFSATLPVIYEEDEDNDGAVEANVDSIETINPLVVRAFFAERGFTNAIFSMLSGELRIDLNTANGDYEITQLQEQLRSQHGVMPVEIYNTHQVEVKMPGFTLPDCLGG